MLVVHFKLKCDDPCLTFFAQSNNSTDFEIRCIDILTNSKWKKESRKILISKTQKMHSYVNHKEKRKL